MPKQYKVKRYRHVYKAKPNPFSIILSVVGLCALVFVGIILYQPVYSLIMGEYTAGPPAAAGEDSLPALEQQDDIEEPDEQQAPPAPTAQELRVVYMPVAVMADPVQREAFLNNIDSSINTILVDIKDRDGVILFNSVNEKAWEYGAVSETAFDLSAFTTDLQARGLQLAVRMPAFRDSTAAYGDRTLAVRYQGTDMNWLDGSPNAGGKPWLNPYLEEARQYLVDLAVEAANAGAVLVMLEDVQFPDGSSSTNATYGDTGGKNRQQVLKEFVRQAESAVEEAGGCLAVYLPTTTFQDSFSSQERYGGNARDIAGETVVLGVLPYQFYNGYVQDELVIESPYGDVGETVRLAVEYVQGMLGDTSVIPLLQGGSEGQNTITGEQVGEQVSAAQSSGDGSFILYQTQGIYLYQE